MTPDPIPAVPLEKPARRELATARRQRFAELYAQGGLTVTECAKQAGYAPESANRQGHKLLAKPSIQARIQEIRSAAAAQAQLTLQGLIGDVQEIQQAALNAVRKAVKEGIEPPAKLLQEATRASDLLGKLGGFAGSGRGPNITNVNLNQKPPVVFQWAPAPSPEFLPQQAPALPTPPVSPASEPWRSWMPGEVQP